MSRLPESKDDDPLIPSTIQQLNRLTQTLLQQLTLGENEIETDKPRYYAVRSGTKMVKEMLIQKNYKEAQKLIIALIDVLSQFFTHQAPHTEFLYHQYLYFQLQCLKGITAYCEDGLIGLVVLVGVATYIKRLESTGHSCLQLKQGDTKEIEIFHRLMIEKLVITGYQIDGPTTQQLQEIDFDLPSWKFPASFKSIKECLAAELAAIPNNTLKTTALMQALFFTNSFLGAIFDRGEWFGLTRLSDGSKAKLVRALVTTLEGGNSIEKQCIQRFQEVCKSKTSLVSDIKNKAPELFKYLRQCDAITLEMVPVSLLDQLSQKLWSKPPKPDCEPAAEAGQEMGPVEAKGLNDGP